MKKQSSNGFEKISKATLNVLTEEVKETIAKGMHEKIFSSIDLWRIQKSKKSVIIRRAMAI